jgi:phosphate/sulfate permease
MIVDQKLTNAAPNGSFFTYGLVGALLAACALVAVASFYGISLAPHLSLVSGLLGFAFAGGGMLHVRRTALYRRALP